MKERGLLERVTQTWVSCNSQIYFSWRPRSFMVSRFPRFPDFMHLLSRILNTFRKPFFKALSTSELPQAELDKVRNKVLTNPQSDADYFIVADTEVVPII